MEFAIVLGLVLLILIAATATVIWEDRRTARRQAVQRAARLSRLGEVDPLAAARLRADS